MLVCVIRITSSRRGMREMGVTGEGGIRGVGDVLRIGRVYRVIRVWLMVLFGGGCGGY